MESKLIVDSGSTKTDWVIITPNQDLKFASKGTNPSANEALYDLKNDCPSLLTQAEFVNEIHWFGAGVIDQRTKSIIQTWLSLYFKNVTTFHIESDMLGSAKSTAGNSKGIINIMGTGSNSCVYDGTKITANIPALGYALSNEGGGSKIGGELIKSYFYNNLPDDVRTEFEEKYNITKSEVIQNVYKSENPTAYLANFAKFLNETENKEWRKTFLFPIFQEFVDIRIKQYSEYLSYDLYFVGSIAYFYSDILRDVLQYNNLTCSSIIRKPIDGLVSYFK